MGKELDEKIVTISMTPSLDHTSKKDHTINIIKASLSLIPVIGGSLASLISDYLPTQKQERLKEVIEDIALKLEEYKEEVNLEYIHTDEYAYLFEKSLEGVVKHYQKQKIRFFKGIIINSLRKKAKQEEKEYYLYLIDSLSELHLNILALFNNPDQYFEFYNLNKNVIVGDSISKVISYAIPEMSKEIIISAYSELYQMGLINTDKSIFVAMTLSTGLEIMEGRVTDLGKKFITFCNEF